ncbi:uncharacterized protein LOC142499925 [Ascaphus truei]|uniref:uncharacterized protein LOC142499925 n=1 Tax=Ascaphus truei TaxID=8439 RepID=UPI003F5A905C
MSSDDTSVPAYARLKDSVRLEFTKERKDRSLEYIVKKLLLGLFEVRIDQILAIQDYPKRGVYDVTFTSGIICQNFHKNLQEHIKDPLLEGVKVTLHHLNEEKLLIVKMYSPHVPADEIKTFLDRYCTKVVFVGNINNEFGIWTSKRKFLVTFKKDPLGLDGVMRPPARFKLGKFNGDLFYAGMPFFCRLCTKCGHTKESCKEKTYCTNCGAFDHDMRNCTEGKKCNLCQKTGHLYSFCPQRYRQNAADTKKKESEKPKEDSQRERAEESAMGVSQLVVKETPEELLTSGEPILSVIPGTEQTEPMSEERSEAKAWGSSDDDGSGQKNPKRSKWEESQKKETKTARKKIYVETFKTPGMGIETYNPYSVLQDEGGVEPELSMEAMEALQGSEMIGSPVDDSYGGVGNSSPCDMSFLSQEAAEAFGTGNLDFDEGMNEMILDAQ